ncbi:unnamed protein product [Rotaria magnacalcarata]|uniref:Transposase n=1 Tax=Rotaria magnacalcarata TaxID=392030 RepID=A0A819NI40_9BILA|nr:unnamed protein product [Rotaria magnacalcarata]
MDKYRQSPPTIANTLVGWIVNLSMQTILQMFHPIYSPHQQYMRTALNVQARVIYEELYSVFADEGPPLRTVERWAKWFREGHEEVDDEARPGRPVTETTTENIEQIRHLIDDDPYSTIEELQEQTGLGYSTTQRIISDHLQLRKITARYIPKHLTDFQRAERVRICEENLEKFEKRIWRLCDVVTGDESWFYHKQIGRKSTNAAWVAKGHPPPTVVRLSKFEEEQRKNQKQRCTWIKI